MRVGQFVLVCVLVFAGFTTLVHAAPSHDLTTTSSTSQVTYLDNATFTITFNFTDDESLENVVINDTLPSGWSYNTGSWSVTGNSSAVTLDQTLPHLSWSTQSLNVGSNVTLTFTANALCSPTNQSTNNASVTYQWQESSTPQANVTASNSSGAITVTEPNLVVSYTPTNQVSNLNEQDSWQISIQNTGNGAADQITVSHTLGYGFNAASFTSFSNGSSTVNGSGSQSDRDVTWPLSIGPGQTWSTTVYGTPSTCSQSLLNAILDVEAGSNTCTYFNSTTNRPTTLRRVRVIGDSISSTIAQQINQSIHVNVDCDVYQNFTVTEIVPSSQQSRISNLTSTSNNLNVEFSRNNNIFTWLFSNISGGNFSAPFDFWINISSYLNDDPSNSNGVDVENEFNVSYAYNNQTTSSAFYSSNTADNLAADSSTTSSAIEPSLTLSKTSSEAAVSINETFTYTITATNVGTSPAYNVTLTDLLPDGTYFVSSTQALQSQNGRELIWTTPLISTSGSWSTVVTARVNETYESGELVLANDTLMNTVNVSYESYNQTIAATYGATVREYAGNTNEQVLVQSPPLSVTRDKSTAAIGELITYTVNSSFGGAPANNVVMTNTLPAGLVFVNQSHTNGNPIFQQSGQALIFDYGNITQRFDYSVTITAYINDTNANSNDDFLINNAQLVYENSTSGSTFTITDSTSSTITEPSLTPSKTVNQTVIPVNQSFLYTISFNNDGSSTAYNITINDTLPDGLIFQSSTQSLQSQNGRELIWNVPSVANAGSWSTQITVKVNETYESGEFVAANDTFVNSVSMDYVSYNQTIARSYNGTVRNYTNSTSDSGFVITEASLSHSVNKSTATIGELITYTNQFDFTNSYADMVIINNTLSSAMTYVSHTSSTNPMTFSTSGQTQTFDFGNISAREIITVTVSAYITDVGSTNAGDILTNNVNAYYSNSSGSAFSYSDSSQTTILEPSDTLQKVANGIIVSVNETFTYNISFTNNGTSTGYNITINDTLPDGTYFVSSTKALQSQNNRELIYNIPALEANTPWSTIITARVNETYDAGRYVLANDTLNNLVNMSYFSYNQTIAATYSGTVRGYGSLANDDVTVEDPQLGLSRNKATATIGELITYTVTHDFRDAPANNVVVTNTLPAGTVFVNYSNTTGPQIFQQSGQALIFDYGNLTDRQLHTISITAYINNTASNNVGDVLTNNLQLVYENSTSGLTHTRTSSTQTTIQEPNITIEKTLLSSSAVSVGDIVEYRINLTNLGNYVGYNITLTDLFDDGLLYNASSQSYVTLDPVSRLVTWNFPTLTAGSSQLVYLNMSVSQAYLDATPVAAFDSLSNNANISYYSYNQTIALGYNGTVRNYDQVTVVDQAVILNPPTVSKQITHSQTDLTIGEWVNYTLVADFSKAGGYNTVINDTLPTGLVYVGETHSGSASFSQSGQTLSWNYGNITNQNITLEIKAYVNDIVGNVNGNILSQNTIDVTHYNKSLNAFTPSDTSNTITLVEPSFELTKVASKEVVSINETFTYNITLQNSGSSTAYNVTINDTLPDGTYFVSSTQTLQSQNSRGLIWNISTLNASDVWSTIVSATVNESYQSGSLVLANDTLNNLIDIQAHSYNQTIAAQYSGTVRTYTKNTSEQVVVTPPTFDISRSKNPLSIGEIVTYTITSNFQEAPANNVVVTSTLPTGTVFVNQTNSSQNNYTFTKNGQILTFNFGNINIQEILLLTVKAYVNDTPSNTQNKRLTNNAQLVYENSTSGNTITLTDRVNIRSREPQIELSKTLLSSNSVSVGDIVQYRLNMSNEGRREGYNITLTDSYSDGLLYNASDVGTVSVDETNRSIIWNFPYLDDGDEQLVYVNFTVSSTYQNGLPVAAFDSLNNQVNITYYSYNQTIAAGYNGTVRNYTSSTFANQPVILNAPSISTYITHSQTDLTIGEWVNYTLVADFSKAGGYNTVINDTLPTGLVYVGETHSGSASFSQSGQTLSWNYGNITNQNITLEIKAYVNDILGNVNGNILSQNTIDVTHYNKSLNAFTPSDTSNTIVLVEPSQTISKTSNETIVSVNETFTYNIIFTNNGSSTAYNITVNDTLPDGINYVSNTQTLQSQNGRELIWNVPSLNAASQWSTVVSAIVNETYENGNYVLANDTFVNTVNTSYYSYNQTIAAGYSGTVRGYGTEASDGVTVKDATTSVTRDKSAATIGELITYTLTNDFRDAPANNVVVTNTLPTGTVFVNYSNTTVPQTFQQSGQALIFNYGNLTDRQLHTLTISAYINDTASNNVGDVLTNNLQLVYENSTSGLTHTRTSSTQTTIQEPNVTISKGLISNSTASVGDTVQYVLNVTNVGSSLAYNVSVIDYFDDGFIYNTSSLPYHSLNHQNDTIQWFLNLSASQSQLIYLNLTVNTTYGTGLPVSSNDIFSNTANLTYQSYNASIAQSYSGTLRDYSTSIVVNQTVVVDPASAQFTLTPTTATIGERVSYSATVDFTRGGGYNTIINTTLPTGLVYVGQSHSGSASFSQSGQTLSWNYGNITTQTVTLNFDTYINDISTNTNSTILSNTTLFSYYQNNEQTQFVTNQSTLVLTIVEPSQLLTKNANQSVVSVAQSFSYNISFTNNGSSTAYNITVNDTLPDGISYISNTQTLQSQNGRELIWNIPSLESQNSWSSIVQASVDETYAGGDYVLANDTLENLVSTEYYSYNQTIAETYSGTVREYGANSQDQVTLQDPTSSSNVNFATAVVGQLLTFTVQSDFRGAPANNVVATDTLPNGMSYYSYTNSTGPMTFEQSGQSLIFNYGNLTSRDLHTITINACVVDDGNTTVGSILTNNLQLTYENSTSGETFTKTDSDQITIVEPNITVEKSIVGSANIGIGQVAQYKINITNHGLAIAYNTTVTDVFEDGLLYSKTDVGYTTFDENNRILTWNYPSISASSSTLIYLNLTLSETYSNGSNTTEGKNYYNRVNVTYQTNNKTNNICASHVRNLTHAGNEVNITSGYLITGVSLGKRFVRPDKNLANAINKRHHGLRTVRLAKGNFGNSGDVIAEFDFNFTQNIDVSSINMDTSRFTRKAFVHDTASIGQTVSKTLYIPRVSNTNQVYICPGATSLAATVPTCNDKITIRNGQTKNGMTVTNVTKEGEAYYKVTGITGTGGGEGSAPILLNPQVTPTSSNLRQTYFFRVNYTDAENDTASYVTLELNNQTNYTMYEQDSADTDVIDGKIYEYNLTGYDLSNGTHSFAFYAADEANVSANRTSSSGPTVTPDAYLNLTDVSDFEIYYDDFWGDFQVYYYNSSDDSFIDNATYSAQCNITISSQQVENVPMDALLTLYKHTDIMNTPGSYPWSATCNSPHFDTITKTKYITVTQSTAVPEWEDYALLIIIPASLVSLFYTKRRKKKYI